MKLTPTMVMTVIENVYGSGGNNGMTMMMMTIDNDNKGRGQRTRMTMNISPPVTSITFLPF